MVTAAKKLLSRDIRTVDTWNMFNSLLSNNTYDSNNISVELSVLDNGLLQDTYESLLPVAPNFAK